MLSGKYNYANALLLTTTRAITPILRAQDSRVCLERRSFELLLAVHRVIISTAGTNDELDDDDGDDDRSSSFGV